MSTCQSQNTASISKSEEEKKYIHESTQIESTSLQPPLQTIAVAEGLYLLEISKGHQKLQRVQRPPASLCECVCVSFAFKLLGTGQCQV